MATSPVPSAWTIELIRWSGTEIVLEAQGTAPFGVCPTCGVTSSYVHARYLRRPHDLPWRGRPVRLRLQVRRFRCLQPTCPRHTFAEPFEPVLRRYAHFTADAAATLLTFGRAAGAAVGHRLAACSGMRGSATSLLRLVRRSVPPMTNTPVVLGLDEFSFTRRHFATVLVDLQTHRPIDLIDTHKAEPVATWLREHPGVEVVVRDRGGAFADAGRQGAPAAIQVADRFHILHNGGQAMEEVLRGRRRRIDHAIVHAEDPPSPLPLVPVRPPSQEQQRASAVQQRRVRRWEEVRERHQRGDAISAIARAFGMSRMTVRHLVQTPEPPPPIQMPPRPGGLRSPSLQPFVTYLQDRWQAGCQNISQLDREIRALGYRGSRSLLHQSLLPWRPPKPPRGSKARRRLRHRSFSVRWLCLRPPDQLDADEQAALATALAEDVDLAFGHRLLQDLRRLVADRDLVALDRWLADAATSGLAPFVRLARGLRDDRAAVEAALRLPWSTGPVEGHVNRIKLLKRQGFGRAKLDLLKARVLTA